MATTLTVQHQIRDYDVWRPAFDQHQPVRRQHGSSQETVYRGAEDANNILIVMDFPSRDAALSFLGDPSLKAVMENASVISEPKAVLGETLATQPA